MALFVVDARPEVMLRPIRRRGGQVRLNRCHVALDETRALGVFEADSQSAVTDHVRTETDRHDPPIWSAWHYAVPGRELGSGHHLVVVERSFPQPVHLPRLEASERAAAWCLDLHRVEFLWHYVADDGKAMVCIYGAPDAEAVRATQTTAGMPYDHIWSARLAT